MVDTWDLKSHGLKSRVGSTPTLGTIFGELAQLGEHLPYKQRVGGSSPSFSTIAEIAPLVEQLTCNQ